MAWLVCSPVGMPVGVEFTVDGGFGIIATVLAVVADDTPAALADEVVQVVGHDGAINQTFG